MMSQFTNFGENKLIDKFRAQVPPYPATYWFVAFGSAADDGSFTEITGADLPRVAVDRSLLKWAGTQGAGTTLASSGTSHTTSNNDIIQFATAASDRGTAAFVGLFDASTGGNCWVWLPIDPFAINLGDTPAIAAGALQMSLGLTGGCTDYLANKLIDEIFRGQAWSPPATLYARLFTTAATNAGGGVEVSGGSYARPGIAGSLAALSGTQAAGSTSASSGTSGRSSNNAALSFPAPTADWGIIAGDGLGDASTGGNLLLHKTYSSAKTVSAGGSAPSWAPNALGITLA